MHMLCCAICLKSFSVRHRSPLGQDMDQKCSARPRVARIAANQPTATTATPVPPSEALPLLQAPGCAAAASAAATAAVAAAAAASAADDASSSDDAPETAAEKAAMAACAEAAAAQAAASSPGEAPKRRSFQAREAVARTVSCTIDRTVAFGVLLSVWSFGAIHAASMHDL